MGVINIIPVSAPLPVGWEGTPDEFREQIFSTLTFEASGDFLTGQIGGATPTTDVGLFIDGRDLYTWDAGLSAYRPINTDPIGALKAYLGLTAPANYLLCDGADYAQADYTDLFALIGTAFNRGTDASDRFRVPDLRGRTLFGAGVGDYNPKEDGVPGRMKELTLRAYDGKEWPQRKIPRHPNQPAKNLNPGDCMVYTGTTSSPANTHYTRAVPPHVAVNWLIRAL